MGKALRAAWPHTIPVLAGYGFLGITFGFLMQTYGYPFWYPVLMSVVIYSGALEFAAIPLLASSFDPIGSFVMAFLISARHLFYGIPMLKKYEKTGLLRLPLIFTLTDETFSVSSALDAPESVEKKYFYGSISLLNYGYWVGGTVLGALFGKYIRFDATGIDFALTALFLVLFLEQLHTKEGKISGCIGFAATAVVLIFFGAENMVVISMGVILFALLLVKRGICHD